MGMFDQLVGTERVALALLLGFALVVFVILAYLSGRGKHSHYDGQGIEPIESYGAWVKEASGRVPLFLKLWIVAVIGIALALTGIVIRHGYWY
ncbi:MAG TPA: hypothetical protein VN690_04615 [Terriglobales bacterium]|nr:hypothetical protein [Terriglobales bacterium]